jgi:LPXTG-site transpeptidase (sortase) family protein
MSRWRLIAGLIGVVLIAVSSTVLLWPVIFGAKPGPTAALERLPQPTQIISPANFPSPLPVGNQQIPREPPVSPYGWRIRLPSLNINLPLVQGDGLNVPYFKAAHYPTMPWPGQGQRSFVYAHAQYGPPIMFGPLLGHNATGTDVYLDRGGASTLHYVIRQYYAAWPISDTRWLQPADHEELILMTCTSWNASDPRVIAVAEPVG